MERKEDHEKKLRRRRTVERQRQMEGLGCHMTH
jgi:hypothetical protein